MRLESMESNNIQLFICLGAIIWVVWLFLAYGAKHKSSVETKVHTIYLGGIGTFLLMELVVYLCLHCNQDPRTIMDTVTFGATLSSLILSVVAIFFTLSSGRDNDKTLGRINSAIDHLDKTADKIVEFANIANSLSEKTEHLKTRIEDLHKFEKNKWDTFHYISRVMFKENTQISEITETENSSISDWSTIYEMFVGKASYFGVLGLLSCSYAEKTEERKFNIEKLAKSIGYPSIVEYMQGYLIASASIGIININLSDKDIKEITVNYNLEKLCLQRIADQVASYDDEDDQKILNNTMKVLNAVRQFFNMEKISKEQLITEYGK